MPTPNHTIAPCGMNCGVCRAHLINALKCPGCLIEDDNKPPTRKNCNIKNCENIRLSRSKFCFECENFPCKRLQQLDERYRAKYAMSMIENLEFIKEKGLSAFIDKERERWRCKKCGGIICVHLGYCSACGEK